MRNLSLIAASIALFVAILACNLPSSSEVGAVLTAAAQTQTALVGTPASATPTATSGGPTPTNTLPAVPTACSPTVTANLNANVREGDSTDYDIVGFLADGASAPLLGRNAADTWWYIQSNGGHGWVAKSITTASCLPASVAVVVPPPPPPTAVPPPPAPEFAVTHVTYSFSEADYGGHNDCPKMTAHITTSGAGTVYYKWERSDGANAPTYSIDFASAGTQAVSTNWSLGSVWEGTEFWLGLYIDDPNHQGFGHETFTDACDG